MLTLTQYYFRLRKKYFYKVEESEIIRKLIKPGMIAADLGANDGYHTLLMADCVGQNGKVFSFEPESTAFGLLQNNVIKHGFKNIQLIQKAVVHKSEKRPFYLCQDQPGSHSLFSSERHIRGGVIETITLDEFLEPYQQKLDYLKLDIEGSELLALKGSKKVLIKNKNLIIFFEYNQEVLSRSGEEPSLLLDYLSDNDFHYFYKANRRMKSPLKVSKSDIANIQKGMYWNAVCSRNPLN